MRPSGIQAEATAILKRLNASFARGRKIKADDARHLAATFDPLIRQENTCSIIAFMRRWLR